MLRVTAWFLISTLECVEWSAVRMSVYPWGSAGGAFRIVGWVGPGAGLDALPLPAFGCLYFSQPFSSVMGKTRLAEIALLKNNFQIT